nr:EOG090X06W9 [Macrothrix elegans]
MEIVTETSLAQEENTIAENTDTEPVDGDALPSSEQGEVTLEEPVYYPEYCLDKPWTSVCSSTKEFRNGKSQIFLKGCKWSPDGTCLLTSAEDYHLRLFDLPADLYNSHKTSFQGCATTEWTPSLKIKEGGTVYDFCWHPLMSSWNPDSCLLLSTAKGGPIHMWDAYKGSLAATYRPYNNVDEVEAANSLCISPDGEKLYSGFDKCIRVFDVQVAGRNYQTRPTKSRDATCASQSGIISCIAVNPALPSVYAAGSYMKTVGLYSEPDGTALCVMEGHRGGVTHVRFSPDGMMLFTGGRKDPEILCWDLRQPGHILLTMTRTVHTNQRIYFDLDPTGRYLISGDTNGLVIIWDTKTGLETNQNGESYPPDDNNCLAELNRQTVNNDCTNGVSCHPWLPLVATSSGQRHLINPGFLDSSSSSDDDEDLDQHVTPENSVKLWAPRVLINSNFLVHLRDRYGGRRKVPLLDSSYITSFIIHY